MIAWPEYKRAKDLAGAVFPVSEDVILRVARKHGIGRKMGRAVVFSPTDVQQLYEALPSCHSKSSVVPNHPIGSSAAPSAESALKKALALAIDGSPKKSARSARARSSSNRSTVVPLRQHSPKQP